MLPKDCHNRKLSGCSLRSQSGAALITVMLVISIIAIIVLAMTESQQLDIRRTLNIFDSDQAYWMTKGVEDWAICLLLKDQENSTTDNLGEEWAAGLPETTFMVSGSLSGEITDLQGRFNLNNLVSANSDLQGQSRIQFEKLLNYCGIAPEFAEAVIDWQDADDEGVAEDWAYDTLSPPYRTANQPMMSPTELLQIKGIDLKGYDCLAPLVATLPSGTGININTAPVAILSSLSDVMTTEQADSLITARPQNGYEDIGEFLASPEFAGSGLVGNYLMLKSDFFMVESRASMGKGRCVLYSILQRRDKEVKVLRRTIGTY